MISVIIPTLHEEKYLPFLLSDLKKQSVKPEEIIVVDAKSKDKTAQIAKKAGAKVILTKKGTSHQRNTGAKKAKGDWLLFIDADMRLPDKDTIKKLLNASKDAVVVIPRMTVDKEHRSMGHILLTEPGNIIARWFPHKATRGGCILVKKSALKKVGGFNEQMAVAEDLDLGERISVGGRVRYANVTVYESNRRYAKQGLIGVVMEWIVNGIYGIFFRRSYVTKRSEVR